MRSRSRAASSKRRASASSRSRRRSRGSADAGCSQLVRRQRACGGCARSPRPQRPVAATAVGDARRRRRRAARARRTARGRATRAFAGGRSSRIRRSSSSAASSSEPSTRHSIRSTAAERRLHRRPLPVAAEVRAKPRAQVARAADVQHLAVPAAEEVDAGPASARRRRAGACRRRARPRRREPDEIGDRPRAALLREPDQREQHLRRRLRIGQRAVARLHRRRRGNTRAGARLDARDAAGEQPRARAARCRPRARRCREPVSRSVSRSRNARSKRALCATSTASPANVEEAADRDGGRRRAAQLLGRGARSTPRRPARAAVPGSTSVSNSSTSSKPADAHGADLADLRRARPQARRLEVDDDVRRVLEQQRRRRRPRRARRASPRQASRASASTTSASSERASATGAWRSAKSCRAASSADDRPAPLLHELHEPVGRV